MPWENIKLLQSTPTLGAPRLTHSSEQQTIVAGYYY